MAISTRTRRSWREGLIVLTLLSAAAPLLQGCEQWYELALAAYNKSGFTDNEPSIYVPGVGEVFLRKDPTTGQYVLKAPDENHRYVRVGPDDPRYPTIDAFFHPRSTPNSLDRVGLPGGAGSSPSPPLQ